MNANASPAAENPQRPVVLCILDGWGERDESLNNAIKMGKTPNWDRMVATCPRSRLQASGLHVGLPDGQMGNSEVGHMTIGAGRVVLQDLPRIDHAIHDGELDDNPALVEFIEKLQASGGTCHLLGLLSTGGVHSQSSHIRYLAGIVGSHGIPVKVHAFLDGRDTPPKSAADFVKRFEADIRFKDGVSVATVSGRYWAMDRDKRWDRVRKAYRCIAGGQGGHARRAIDAVLAAYEKGVTDEFVEPTAIADYRGMQDGDGLLMANFRADRAREILSALADPNFVEFEREFPVTFAACTGMAEYSDDHKRFLTALFPPVELTDILSEVISRAGLKQLHIAETEKYAHVTFFFNGGREDPYEGEDRILIRSPDVATYDLKPEMSAPEVTDKLVAAIESGKYDFIVVNYANGDMVGHTGVMNAAVKAVEVVDACLGRVEKAVKAVGGVMLITADHGNCEKMMDGPNPHTAHTLFKVPAVLVNGPSWAEDLRTGGLADLAPTVLQLMGMAVPADMEGTTLISEDAGGEA
ncbi:MAG: 2,3-bisphosphoglycerate-independent phosphoglycerate mutase [Alphaproteobacteria bacterium]|nr:2,3-bisphosphoglycerate-independent phosphoglycerate mutase [Alphaproteobacteria bacterium]MBF0251907.1 2,3-bisphosphoglycerate-independent phosphoglycerate mutase [Alphaproteobacteria bacterium]